MDCGGPGANPQCPCESGLDCFIYANAFFSNLYINIKFTFVKKGPLSLLGPYALLILAIW